MKAHSSKNPLSKSSPLRTWALGLMVLAGASFTIQAGTAADIRIEPASLAFAPVATTPIYVELDWMEDGTHSHRPSQAVIDTIVATFAREGYTIHIDVSNAIPHQAVLAITNSPSGSASVQAIKAAHFNNADDSRYFYSIWGHNYSYNGGFTTSSGIGDLPGSTHLVTLGSFAAQVGSFSNQVGTFVHEFGHNINQRHGGADHGNYKPNYISVMNYYYQLNGLGPSLLALQFAHTSSGFNSFGYSHGSLPSLNEANLNETLGIGLGRARDWNCDGTMSPSIARDIQASNPCNGTGGFSVLADYDNWAAINAFVRTGAEVPHFTGAPSEICITPEEDLPVRTLVEDLRAQGLLPDESTLVAPPAGPDSQFAGAKLFDVNNDGDTTLTVTGISLDSPAGWVTFEPQSFSVPPGAAQRVYVYVNFATMPGGAWTRRLLVASNDPDQSPYPGGVHVSVGGLPVPFGKTSPSNGASSQNTSPTLAWGSSIDAASYQYCIDTSNNNTCDATWTSTGTNTSVVVPGLAAETGYYWHVRAINGGGTTYADGSATAFWSFTTQTAPPGTELIRNGDFSDGLTHWTPSATPDISYIEWTTSGERLQFARVPGPGGTESTAEVFQSTGQPLAAFAPLEATFTLGNADNVRKRIRVVLHDADGSDGMACSFVLDADAPLRSYAMRTHTTEGWTNATLTIQAATAGLGGAYLVDDVSLKEVPGGRVDRTICVDPTAPAPTRGASQADLIVNGSFASGLAPWVVAGQIVHRIANGVFEFHRPAVGADATVLQTTGQALADAEPIAVTLHLGNSSAVRKRVEVRLVDADLSDVAECTVWLAPGQLMTSYQMRTFTTKAWADATVAISTSTVGTESWIRLDNVRVERIPGAGVAGTECITLGMGSDVAVDQQAAASPVARGLGDLFEVARPVAAGADGWEFEQRIDGTAILRPTDAIDLRLAGRARLTFFSLLASSESIDSRAEVQVRARGGDWQTVVEVLPTLAGQSIEIDLHEFLGHEIEIRFVYLPSPLARHAPYLWAIADVIVITTAAGR